MFQRIPPCSLSRQAILMAGAILALSLPEARADFIGVNDFTAQATVGTTNTPTNSLPSFSSDGKTLTLTDNNDWEASSGFYGVAQSITEFTAQFTYQVGGNKAADGATFAIVNNPNDLGGRAAGLGYHGISNSAAVEFNIYTGNPNYTKGTNFYTDGDTGFYNSNRYRSTGAVDLASGHPIQVNLSYDGTTLTEKLTDLTTHNLYTTSYTTDLPSVLGGNTAYIGFTGGTGGLASIQTISDVSYTAIIPEPNSLTLLGLGLASLAAYRWRRRCSAA